MMIGRIFSASLAACALTAPAIAKHNWTPPVPAENGGMWTVDLASIETVGKLDPRGPYIQVRLHVNYEKVRRGDIRRNIVTLQFRCDKQDGKIAGQTDWIERYGPVPRWVSFDRPFVPIPKTGDMRDVFNIVCRPNA